MHPPPMAAFKEDHKWNRDLVQSTVRQWFPYMAVSDRIRTEIKREWGTYFDMPTDLDPNQLPEQQHLKWVPLPQHVDTMQRHKVPAPHSKPPNTRQAP